MATINDMFGLGLKRDEKPSGPAPETSAEPVAGSVAPAPDAQPSGEEAGEAAPPTTEEEPKNE